MHLSLIWCIRNKGVESRVDFEVFGLQVKRNSSGKFRKAMYNLQSGHVTTMNPFSCDHPFSLWQLSPGPSHQVVQDGNALSCSCLLGRRQFITAFSMLNHKGLPAPYCTGETLEFVLNGSLSFSCRARKEKRKNQTCTCMARNGIQIGFRKVIWSGSDPTELDRIRFWLCELFNLRRNQPIRMETICMHHT